MLSLLCSLPFGVFSGQHIFHQFRQQTFFFRPHFRQTFFSDFCGDNCTVLVLVINIVLMPDTLTKLKLHCPVVSYIVLMIMYIIIKVKLHCPSVKG